MSAEGRPLLLRGVSDARMVAIAVASLLAAITGIWAFTPLGGGGFHWFLLLPVVGLVVAGVAAMLAPLPAQLFARAVQWSNLGLGFVLAVLGTEQERPRGALLAIGCGTALLMMGRQGLVEAERRAGFVPAALRSSLLLLMVLALADAQTFALFGAALLGERDWGGIGYVLVGAALALTCGFVLLMRLSLVGLVLNVLACGAVLGWSVAYPRHIGSDPPTVVGTLALVHLLVALPTIVSAVRGKSVGGLGPRARSIGATTVIGLVMSIALLACLVKS